MGTLVRKDKCSGCCYSREAVAYDAKEGREAIKADSTRLFHCHQYSEDEGVICRGFYEAYPERVPEPVFVRFKGLLHHIYKHAKPGDGYFRKL